MTTSGASTGRSAAQEDQALNRSIREFVCHGVFIGLILRRLSALLSVAQALLVPFAHALAALGPTPATRAGRRRHAAGRLEDADEISSC